ncbi:MAG TPA: HK97 family phage prohead protease [Sphingomicrobium sp.]|jgi:HK97 family phage prohead protease|nr:HK97 family phage prohead protease [Sphingomicrobium sp.]
MAEPPGRVRFAGYAAVFDRLDNGGDVIRAGAFRETLKRCRSVPLLWQHRTGAVIGRIDTIREDRKGLRVIGTVCGGERAAEVAGLLSGKRVDGLSFGYRVREARRRDGVRELLELDLVEVSVVQQPMQPSARIHALED